MYDEAGEFKKIKEIIFEKTLTNYLTSLNLTEVRYVTENVKIKNE